jgi:hypothetical protein
MTTTLNLLAFPPNQSQKENHAMTTYLQSESGLIIRTDRKDPHNNIFWKDYKLLSKKDGERALKEQSKARLLDILKQGDTVYCVLRSVSKSGMSRRIDFYVIKDNRPIWLTGHMAVLSDRDAQTCGKGMRVDGGGMDMGFHEVYNLARRLWPEGNLDRTDRDAGYLLKSEWI